MPHPTRLAVAAVSLTALTALSACGAQDDTSGADPEGSSAGASAGATSPSTSPSDAAGGGKAGQGGDGRRDGARDGGAGAASTPVAPADLVVEIAGDDVSPNAAELDAGVGDQFEVSVSSDRAGELHVHSTPEQYVEFGAGEMTQELTFSTPGTVEVEDHDTGAVVAFIDVR